MKLRIVILTLSLSLFGIITAFGQGNIKKIDSLIVIAKQATDFASADALVNKIIIESKAINYTKGIVKAQLIKGVNLYNGAKYEEALKLTYAIENNALTTQDFENISHLYALRGNCYGRLLFFEKSDECLKQSIFYAEKIPDRNVKYYSLGRAYGIIANNLKYNTAIPLNLDSILYYRKKSFLIQEKITSKGVSRAGHISQSNSIALVYLEKKNLDSARKYLNNSLALIKKHKLEKYLSETYLGFGGLFYEQKQLDSSLHYYKEALKISLRAKSVTNIQICYKKISLIYEHMGDTQNSFIYLKKHSHLTDSLSLAHKNAVKESSEIILEEKENVFENKTLYYTSIIIGSVVLLIILIYILIALRKQHQKTIAVHKSKQEHLYEKLAFLKNQTTTDKVDDQILKEIIELAMVNDPSFLIKFQEYHPVFMQKLIDRAPTLVTSDLLICAQLRLGFYTKEIARYTKASVRAIEGKKYRIRKKLNIPAVEDINVWMMKI